MHRIETAVIYPRGDGRKGRGVRPGDDGLYMHAGKQASKERGGMSKRTIEGDGFEPSRGW